MGEIHEKSGPIRVLLADDHTIFREGLASILASYGGLEVVAEVPNDAEAIRLLATAAPSWTEIMGKITRAVGCAPRERSEMREARERPFGNLMTTFPVVATARTV